jgi:hypothetical protein
VIEMSPEWVKSPEQVSPVVGLLPLASGQACFGMAVPPFLMSYTAVTRSSLPRLWEQGIPREGEDDCWIGDAMVLRVTTPCSRNEIYDNNIRIHLDKS